MIFKTMKPEDVRQALEGQVNVLTPAYEQTKKYFDALRCPNCGGRMVPIVNPRQLFKEGAVLPNYLAECADCHAQFEPYTGIEIQRPTEPLGMLSGEPGSLVPGEVDLLPDGTRRDP